MTAEAVNRDAKPSGSKTAGRKGPLSSFLHGDNHANASIRSAGTDSPEPNDSPGKSSSRFKRERTFGQGFSNQRRHRKPKRRPATTTTKPRLARRAKLPRPQDGGHDAATHTAHRGPLTPTAACVQCGEPVVFTNETRCEDCWADDQGVWHGRSLNLVLYKDC